MCKINSVNRSSQSQLTCYFLTRHYTVICKESSEHAGTLTVAISPPVSIQLELIYCHSWQQESTDRCWWSWQKWLFSKYSTGVSYCYLPVGPEERGAKPRQTVYSSHLSHKKSNKPRVRTVLLQRNHNLQWVESEINAIKRGVYNVASNWHQSIPLVESCAEAWRRAFC